MSVENERLLVSVKEFAGMVGLNHMTIFKMIWRRELSCIKAGWGHTRSRVLIDPKQAMAEMQALYGRPARQMPYSKRGVVDGF
jgi:hypothetical protein